MQLPDFLWKVGPILVRGLSRETRDSMLPHSTCKETAWAHDKTYAAEHLSRVHFSGWFPKETKPPILCGCFDTC